MSADGRVAALVELSRELGLESRQLAILGEGNTSTLLDDGTFLVKASGSSLATLESRDVTRVDKDAVLGLIDQDLDEQAIEDALLSVRIDAQAKKPSVETFLHALCLSEAGVNWVGHTHTVSVNQALCSEAGASAFKSHIFPDVIVVCGLYVASVPYVDPGLELARAVRSELNRFREAHGAAPKLLLMENHGPVALGGTAKEVLNIMLMADKWAKTLVGTYAFGGPSYLPTSEAVRIDERLDEAYRRNALRGE